MGPFDAARFSKQVKASLVIPNHYDNPEYPIDLNIVEEIFKKENINYTILGYKESIEV